MNPHASPEEQRIATEAADTPSMLDEKKFLEERRRRLEASLHDHMLELRDRGEQASKVALVGAGALVGVWLVAKALGSISESRKRKKKRELADTRRKQLGSGVPGAGHWTSPHPAGPSAPRHTARGEFDHGRSRPQPLQATTNRPQAFTAPPLPEQMTTTEGASQAYVPPAPPRPTLFETFMESEAGRMMTNQLVALLMVFVTRKLEALLQIERSADIGAVKESDLTPYRIVDPVSDATVVTDDATVGSDAAASARSNAAPAAPPTPA